MRLIFSSVLIISAIMLALLLLLRGNSELAKIGSQVQISDDIYDHALDTTLLSLKTSGLKLDSPDFKACVADAGTSPKKQAKQACQKQYNDIQKQVFIKLIQQGWVLAAAEKANLTLSDKQVKSQVDALRQQYSKNKNQVSDEALTFEAKFNLTQSALQQKALLAIKPSSQQLSSFYQDNLELFAKPPTRDINLLVSNNRNQAAKAVNALKAGQSWPKVFKKYNSPELYNAQTAKANNVAASNFSPPLSKIIFTAPSNQVSGPKKITAGAGWAVVEVIKIISSEAAPAFNKNKEQALVAYQSKIIAKNNENYLERLAKTWQPLTVCSEQYASWYPCQGTKQ